MSRKRTLLLAFVALLVPLPAFALDDGDSEPTGAAEIAVSASLGDCGLAETQIVCRINASWSAVEHAEYYTLSVTRADGSVVDYGQSTGTGTSLWVPYVGSGTYSVEVAAWGTPPGEEKAHVIARDSSPSPRTAKPSVGSRVNRSAEQAGHTQSAQTEAAEAEGPGHEPASAEPGEPAGEQPACEEPAPEDAPHDPVEAPAPGDAPEGSDEVPPETADVSPETQAALAAEAELPDSVACP